ncbi:MAG: hypothetical protein ACTSR8_06865 [Promethearchaeota archaeon]
MSDDVKKRDFYSETLDYLLINQAGLTITDIAKALNTSRITASKYIGILEAEKKVVSKQIGAYKLYYSADRSLIPKKVMLAYYSGLLASLKHEIKDKEKYKEFGNTIADFIQFAFTFSFPENEKLRKGPDYSGYFKNFKKIMTYIDFIYEKNPKIKMEKIDNGFLFHMSDIDLFDKSEDLNLHYYIASGVMEKLISRDLKKEVSCDVGDIDVKNRSVNLKITFKE